MKVDIAILTIREDEFTAVRRRFQTERQPIPDGRTYLIGEVKTEKQTYTIAIARCSEQGTDAAQRLAHYIINNLDPQLILVVGIAGGTPREEFTLGDVVVSTRVVNPNVDAWHPDGTTDYATRGGPPHPLVENIVSLLPGEPQLTRWTDIIQLGRPTLNPEQVNITGDDEWRERVRQSLNWHFGEAQNRSRLPTFTTGPILSSNHLMKDPARLREILKTHRSILAVEMEVAGVYEAAQGIDHQYPVMAIRGISDIVGFQRDRKWTEYACQTAAAFTYAFIMTDPLDPPLNSASSVTERMRLVDLYLKNVAATSSQLPWGYLPGDFTSELEIDDVYVLPRFSSKEPRRVNVADERLEREILRQSDQSQEKEQQKHRSDWEVKKPSYLSLYEIVQSGANTAFLGYMGTGKSMAANYIALQLARGEGQSILGLAKPKIPILLRLGRIRETPSSDLLTFAIENSIANFGLATTLRDILRQEWNAGNILLILDALDEFGGEMQWIGDQIRRLGERDLHRSSVLLTSRPGIYRSVSIVGLKAFTLEELQSEEISEFVETWTNAFRKITGRTDLNARDHARSLTHDIQNHPFVREIVSNQLLLTILTILSLRPGGVQVNRVTEAGLLDDYVTFMIERQKSKGVEAPEKYGAVSLRIVFSYTGFEVQRAQSGMFGGICTKSLLLQKLSASKYLKSLGISGAIAEAILDFWLNTGLIQQVDDGTQGIRFRHQAFQFFGAALSMTHQSEETVAKIWADVEKLPGWTDVRRLYIGLKTHPQIPLE